MVCYEVGKGRSKVHLVGKIALGPEVLRRDLDENRSSGFLWGLTGKGLCLAASFGGVRDAAPFPGPEAQGKKRSEWGLDIRKCLVHDIVCVLQHRECKRTAPRRG